MRSFTIIWNIVELANVERVERRYDGAYKIFRFPENVHKSLGTEGNRYPLIPAKGCVGCEIRFIGDDANITMSSGGLGSTVEVYLGDFLYSVMTIKDGTCIRMPLRIDNSVQLGDMQGVTTYFPKNMWRIVCGKDLPTVIYDIVPLSDIRPPRKDKGYQKPFWHTAHQSVKAPGQISPQADIFRFWAKNCTQTF